MLVPITTFYVALIIVIAIALIVWVIQARQSDKVWIGEGGSDQVMRRMRSQANLVETAPFALIAMLLLELNGMSGWFLHLYGIILVVCRVLHPIGMSNRYPALPFRMVGASGTIILLLVAVLALLWQSLFS